MSRVLLATHNKGKLVELRRILEPLSGSVEVLGLDDVAVVDEPVETEATFPGNALLKARAAVASTGLPALADDSGLCVDALNGMPGVLSARWSGRVKDDAANNALLLAQLRDVPPSRRGAEFRCAVAFVLPDGTEEVQEGVMRGHLLDGPRGSGGFGYDPLFVADGWDLTTAELTAHDKDAISHRGRALRAIVPALLRALSPALYHDAAGS